MDRRLSISVRIALAALSPAFSPALAAAMSWSSYCGGDYWFEACDVMKGPDCFRHNNWGQVVSCSMANPPFPGPSDDVDIGASGVVTLPSASVSIRSIRLFGHLTMSNNSLTLGSDIQVFPGGRFTVGSVIIDGAQSLAMVGGDASRLEIGNVGGFTGLQLWNTTLDNQGLTEWQAGAITTKNGSILRNSRTFRILVSQPVLYAGGAAPLFDNRSTGQLTKSGSAGETSIGIAFDNAGLVKVDDGTLTLAGGGVHSGEIDVATTATLHFQAGVHSLGLGTLIPGDGLVRVSIGTVSIDAPVSIQKVEQLSGAIQGASTLQIEDSYRWVAGTMQGTGTTRIAPGATLTVESVPGTVSLDARTLLNDGNVRIQSSATVELRQGAIVTNHGDFEFQGDGSAAWNLSGSLPSFTNTGTLHKSGGAGSSVIAAAFTTSGTVEVASGTLLVRNGHYVQTDGVTRLLGSTLRDTDGEVRIQGGLLTGSGTVHTFTCSNTGTVSPGSSAGSLVCTGDYAQSSAGKLRIEIGGPTPVTQHDVLSVTGAASVAGTLEVVMLNGYVPPLAAEFDVLTAASVSGAFGLTDLPLLPGGKTFQVIMLSNRVRLRVVTQVPATTDGTSLLLAGALAALAIGWLRRNQALR